LGERWIEQGLGSWTIALIHGRTLSLLVIHTCRAKVMREEGA